MKNLLIILIGLLLFLLVCIYSRTGYFQSSLTTKETQIYFDSGDSITTHKYYVDLSGNLILLDKKVIVLKDDWSMISVNAN